MDTVAVLVFFSSLTHMLTSSPNETEMKANPRLPLTGAGILLC